MNHIYQLITDALQCIINGMLQSARWEDRLDSCICEMNVRRQPAMGYLILEEDWLLRSEVSVSMSKQQNSLTSVS